MYGFMKIEDMHKCFIFEMWEWPQERLQLKCCMEYEGYLTR